MNQVMHNVIAHHLLKDAQPSSSSKLDPWQPPTQLYTERESYGMECPFGQFGSAVLAVPLPASCAPPHPEDHGQLKKSLT